MNSTNGKQTSSEEVDDRARNQDPSMILIQQVVGRGGGSSHVAIEIVGVL